MEYKSVEQMAMLARVEPTPSRPLSQVERLTRWAELLEATPDRQLRSFFETEYQIAIVRDAMRYADSPISVAFADPVLRREGLKGDSYGEAKRFFAVTDSELHRVLCYCHHGATLSAATAARAVRGVIGKLSQAGSATGMMARVWRMFA